MEIKTLEIEKFITVKFNEKDLLKMKIELSLINELIEEQRRYNSSKYNYEKIQTLNDFREIIDNKLNELIT